MRNMSFMLTTQQVMDETKTVTRRVGWWKLKQGDCLWAVKKGMGLKKGEKIERLKMIRIVNVWLEPLCIIEPKEVILEGFPQMTTDEFIDMFCKSHKGCLPITTINRIEFEYIKFNF